MAASKNHRTIVCLPSSESRNDMRLLTVFTIAPLAMFTYLYALLYIPEVMNIDNIHTSTKVNACVN